MFGFMSFFKKDVDYVFSRCDIIRKIHHSSVKSLDQHTLQTEPAIFPPLAQPLYPINRAIKQAIEIAYDSKEKPAPTSPLPQAA